jgi:hypothetical protein
MTMTKKTNWRAGDEATIKHVITDVRDGLCWMPGTRVRVLRHFRKGSNWLYVQPIDGSTRSKAIRSSALSPVSAVEQLGELAE